MPEVWFRNASVSPPVGIEWPHIRDSDGKRGKPSSDVLRLPEQSHWISLLTDPSWLLVEET